MRKRGYPDELATGSIAAGGTLGILIPPSVTMIVYGISTGTSIGDVACGIQCHEIATHGHIAGAYLEVNPQCLQNATPNAIFQWVVTKQTHRPDVAPGRH